MKNYFYLIFLVLAAPMHAQQLAFPGAQGWGRFATGGRTGSVYHVTNLNDSGAGSLRDAVSRPNRIVVFDVAGVIVLQSRMTFASNLYVAGQTAPGEGITVYGNGVSFSGASNSIFRHLRIRMGKGGASGKDCAGVANGTNMIFDHCSFAWGLDETFSINADGKGALGDITLQNCVVGQGLLTHSAGGLMQADHITLYRNFYCDNSTRNNKVKGIHQFVNNLVYNWQNGCYIMGGDSEGKSYANTVGNLFINGPSGGGNACTGANADFHIYAADNWQDRNCDGLFNPYLIPQSEYSGGPTFEPKPYDYPELPTIGACDLLNDLLPDVGASLPYRDYVDYYMVGQCRTLGREGFLISTESVMPYGLPSAWNVWKGSPRKDTDGDGMPDEWEAANGTNPAKDDAMQLAANGYCNIENYINSISRSTVEPHLRQPMLLQCTASTATSVTLQWADYTEGEDGFLVEMQLGGTWQELGRTKATTFTAANLPAPATAYTFRVTAYNAESQSESALLTAKTQPEQVELVDVDNYRGDLVFDSDATLADCDGKGILFDLQHDATATIEADIQPRELVVRGEGSLTQAGGGAISGTASVHKGSEGTLSLARANTYTGPTALHGGTIVLAKLANGGEPSSIGASQEFAQNWVWDGGTWKYTGSNATSNRSANLLRDTRLQITSAAATLTMKGRLQGNGGLILAGKGTLAPTSRDFFSYDGDTRLEGGKLLLNGVSTLWTDKNCDLNGQTLVLAGGTLETKDANDAYATYLFPICVEEGTHSVVNFCRNCSIKSRVYGNGTLEMKINYLREYINGNWDDFTGHLIAAGTTGADGSQQLMVNNGTGFRNAVVELKGTNTQIVSWAANKTLYLGGLSGPAGTFLSGFSKQTDSATGTWVVGGAGTDETFAGIIDNRCSNGGHKCTVSIQKTGAGYWRLRGNNVYSGTTLVSEGTLIVNGQHTGTGAVTVEAEATLAGKGTLAGKVTVKADGVLQPGDPNDNLVAATLQLTGGLTMSKGSVLHTAVKKTANRMVLRQLSPKDSVAINSAILDIEIDASSLPLEPGDAIQVMDFSKSPSVSGTGFTTVRCNVEGYEWDTTDLKKQGILRVTAVPDGIRQPQASEALPQAYDLNGRPVQQGYKQGVRVMNGKKVMSLGRR